MSFAEGAVAAFIVALLTTRLAERVARTRALLDIPNERSTHIVPTPRIGGVGIAAGAVVGWALIQGTSDQVATGIMAAALVLAVVGLIDDLGSMRVATKFAAQIAMAAGAAVVLRPEIAIELAGLSLRIDGVLAIGLTIVWLVITINAFNFLDGVDGFMGAAVILICAVGTSLVPSTGAPVLVSVAAACAGFLVWNWAPGSIFMGDVGSQFLGLLVGAALLRGDPPGVAAVPLVVLLAPLLADVGITLFRRWRAGRNILAAHREHLYQRLVAAGRPAREVAAGQAIALGVLGLVAARWDDVPALGQIAVACGVVVGAGLYVRWVDRVEAAGPAVPAPMAGPVHHASSDRSDA